MSLTKHNTDALLEAIRNGDELSFWQKLYLVVFLSLPSIVAQVSSTVMQYIDAAMVGNLGANESAAVGLMSSSIWLFWGVCGAVITGFSVQVAHRIGAKDNEGARSVLRQSLTVTLVTTLLLGLLGALIHKDLPGWLGGAEEIRKDAADYFLVCIIGLPAVIMGWLGANMLRVSGDMKTPSALSVFMCFLDVIFNFFFIYDNTAFEFFGMRIVVPGFGMGVVGAAWGTVLAEALVAVWMLWHMTVKNRMLSLVGHPGSFMPQRDCLKKAVDIGTPIACERFLMCAAQIASTVIVAPLGVFAVAAHSLAITAESLCYMPGYGIRAAAMTLVGQSIGAGRKDMATSLGWLSIWVGMAVMTFMGVVLYVGATPIMAIMSTSKEVVEAGAHVLRIEAFAEPMFAAAIVAYGVCVGAGDTKVPSIINLVSMWAVRLLLAFFMAPVYGLAGVWIAMAFELFVRGAAFLWRVRSGRWLEKA